MPTLKTSISGIRGIIGDGLDKMMKIGTLSSMLVNQNL